MSVYAQLFALLLVTTGVLGQTQDPEAVLDWAGNPVIVESGKYQLWIVGEGNGAVGMGSIDYYLRFYVVDKRWEPNKTFDGVKISLLQPAIDPPITDPYARVATNYLVGFRYFWGLWRINLDVGSSARYFVVTNGGDRSEPSAWFQFIRVPGTQYNPHLYKIVVNSSLCTQSNCPMDIRLVDNSIGEKCLYVNHNNSIPETEWNRVRVSFVKIETAQNLIKSS